MTDWKTISSKIVHKNPYYTVRQDEIIKPNGANATYYVVDRTPFVVIIPIAKDNDIYLIKIGRYTTKKTNWEAPAGSSDGEDLLFAAKRELKEETGLVSNKWKDLGLFEVAPGVSGQLGYVFEAYDVDTSNEKIQKEENIEKMQKFTLKKVLEMIKNGEIVDGPTITAILKLQLEIKSI